MGIFNSALLFSSALVLILTLKAPVEVVYHTLLHIPFSSLLPSIQHPTILQTPEKLRLQKLTDCHILREPLAPPRLKHEVSR